MNKQPGKNLITTLKDSIVNVMCHMARWFIKVDDRVVVFYSLPDYSDNAKALYQYMMANGYDKKYDIYFAAENPAQCELLHGDEARFISFYGKKWGLSLKGFATIMKARYLLYTHSGPFPLTNRKGLKGQLQVNLWHGCGYKGATISADFVPPYDLVLAPGDLHVMPMTGFWNVGPDHVIACGYPRYDWLLHPSEKARRLREEYLAGASKLVIWMPTFRIDKKGQLNQTENIKQFPLIATNDQWRDLDTLCRNLGVKLLVKLHQLQTDYDIDFDSMSNIVLITNNDLDKNGVNLYEFLANTDALITDYSSVAIDYLVVDKPMSFALEDYDSYNEARGFVFDDPLQYMPGHHLYGKPDLEQFLRDVAAGNDPYIAHRERVRKLAIHPSQCYSESVLKALGL